MNGCVLLFPGQGSYKPDIGKQLFKKLPTAQILFEQATNYLGINFIEIISLADSQDIKNTDIQQPLICIINAAYFHYLQTLGISSAIVAGHSLGELCACYAARMIDFEQLILIANIRGKLMQKAAGFCDGGMIAVMGMTHDQLKQLLEEKNLAQIDVANINTDKQVVLSGSNADLLQLESIISNEANAVSRRLYVSGPWHSHYMKPIATEFRQALESFSFKTPLNKLYMSGLQNSVADKAIIKDMLVQQLYSPVDWNALIKTINIAMDKAYFIEVGLSTVLKGLNKKILPESLTYAISDYDDEKKLRRALMSKEKSNVASV